MPEKLGPSHDASEEALQRLAEAFPQAITDGKVDLEHLKQALGEHVETGRERYGLTWPGKAEAIKAAQRPSLGTLRPKVGEGINEASTGNLIIEGDNLEVLKLLQKAYLGKIKMIYIDPPYNTGNDFVYEDNFADTIGGYLEQTGQTADGKRLSTNTETAGRYHSNWLSMMHPRLTLARNLLREDGVIFISIDDNEVANLRKICDEVFGEENFVALLVIEANPRGRHLAEHVATTHEYAAVFSKDSTRTAGTFQLSKTEDQLDAFSEKDSRGLYRRIGLKHSNRKFNAITRPTMHFAVFVDETSKTVRLQRDKQHNAEVFPMNSDGTKSAWTWGKAKVEKEAHLLFAEMGGDGAWRVYRKDYLEDDSGLVKRALPKSIWDGPQVNLDSGSREIKELFDGKNVFDFPKPVGLITRLLELGAPEGGLVLDFFAGSGTTAQAVLTQEVETNFILVQLPEKIDEGNLNNIDALTFCNAAKVPKNIAEITKERVRRVIKKLDGGTKDGLGLDGKMSLDRGFKVYALDRSNFVPWDATASTDVASLEKQLELAVDNVLHDRSDDDLLAEILLKTGFPLDTAVTKVQIAGTPVYQVADPGFLVCLAKKVDAPLIKAIAATKPHRVVILDAAFQGNDALKTNAVQTFKDQGVEMFRTA